MVLSLTEAWGPAEQVKLYRALDAAAGSSTPDHQALRMIREEITRSPSIADPAMHRAVIVFADGGSDRPRAVREELTALHEQGVIAAGFGMTAAGRAMEVVYAPEAQTIERIEDLPDAGVQYLVALIKKWYNI
ncbi:VWA domain-containing protein [Candidatus Peregrinibacteria bacterium]|nr:VWA domain-containing protein [Candidatus Peregrinibacteria bacterium]